MNVKYQDKLNELKAKVFLGKEVEYEEWFSLGINALNSDDYLTSEAALVKLDRPIRSCSNFLLLEYFRVLLEKKTTKKDQATKLLKTLLSKTSKSFVIRTVLDAPNKKLRKHLLEEIKKYKNFKDREKLFLIEILWERGIISRKAADASLQYFLHYDPSDSVTPLILSKEHIRNIHDAYQQKRNSELNHSVKSKGVNSYQDVYLRMIISLMYLKMNLVKKAFDTFYPISLLSSFVKPHRWHAERFFAIENKQTSDNTNPRYFKDFDHFKDITQYLDTQYSQYFDVPYNQAALIAEGLNCSNLFTFAFNSLKYSRDLSILKTVFGIIKKLDPAYYCYDPKKILGYLPLIKKLNEEFSNERVTKEINDYFLSKKHHSHDVALLVFPKECLDKYGLDIKHIKQKFKNHCIRSRFLTGYGHNLDFDGRKSRTFCGGEDMPVIIFKHLYVNGSNEIREFLRQIILEKCFVDPNYRWDANDKPTAHDISLEQISDISNSIGVYNNELGRSFYKDIVKKHLKLRYDIDFKDSTGLFNAYDIWKDISKSYPKKKINRLLTKAIQSKDDYDLLNALEVLKDISEETYAFVNFERQYKKIINLFCKHIISTCKNTSFQTKLIKITSKYHGIYMGYELQEFLNILIFSFLDDKSFEDFINRFDLKEQLNFLPRDVQNNSSEFCEAESILKNRRDKIVLDISKLDKKELTRCYQNFLDDSFNKHLFKYQNTYKKSSLHKRFLEVYGEEEFEVRVCNKLRQFKNAEKHTYFKYLIDTEYKNIIEFWEVTEKLNKAEIFANQMLIDLSGVWQKQARKIHPIIDRLRNMSEFKGFLPSKSIDFKELSMSELFLRRPIQ